MDPLGLGLGTGLTGSAEPGPHGSDTSTDVRTAAGEASIRVRVRPEYLPSRSDPSQPMHVFGYHVTIEYHAPPGAAVAQLVSRRWRIIDARGGEEHVQGEGVVGQQPMLRPGERFEYASYCPLRTSWGTMEGAYGMVLLDQQGQPTARQVVEVGRFYLIANA